MTMPFSPCTPVGDVPCPDKSFAILRGIFGPAVDKLAIGEDPSNLVNSGHILASMFHTFNSGILIVASMIVSYIAMVGVANTANDGEALGKNWSSLWTPMRVVSGAAVLLPTASGYSFIQLVVLMFALWGVGFANSIYRVGIETSVMKPDDVVRESALPDEYYALRKEASDYLGVAYCARMANTLFLNASVRFKTDGASGAFKYAADKTSGAIKLPTDNPGIIYVQKEHFYEMKDRSESTALTGGGPFCGTLSLIEYKQDDKANNTNNLKQSTDTTLQALKAEVINAKREVIYQMIEALDEWMQKWPTRSDAQWDQINSAELNTIVDNHEKLLAEAMKTIAQENQNVRASMQTTFDALTKDGWAMAGGWFQRVALARSYVTEIYKAKAMTIVTPGYGGLPNDERSKVLRNLVQSATDIVIWKANYLAENKKIDPDIENLVQPTNLPGTSASALIDAMNKRLNTTVNRFMHGVADVLLGTTGDGKTPLCGALGKVGGSLSRIKCAGDFMLIGYGVVGGVDNGIKIVLTGTRLLVGLAASLKIVGNSLDLVAVTDAVWDLYIEAIGKQLDKISSYLQPMAFYFSVLLPSLPYAIFIVVVVGWILAVLQAVVAAPLWAVMHMTPDRTFIGSQSQGYLLLLSLFVRPALAIIGLFAAILVSDAIIIYITEAFFAMRGAIVSTANDYLGWFVELVSFVWWLGMFGVVLLPILYMVFGLSQTMPDHVLRWIGAGVADLGETNATGSITHGMGRLATASVAQSRGNSGGAGSAPPDGDSAGGGTGGSAGGAAIVSSGGQGTAPLPGGRSGGSRVRRGDPAEAIGVGVGRMVGGAVAAAGRGAYNTGAALVNSGRQGVSSYQQARADGKGVGMSMAAGVGGAAKSGATGLGNAAIGVGKDLVNSAKAANRHAGIAYQHGTDAGIASARAEMSAATSKPISDSGPSITQQEEQS